MKLFFVGIGLGVVLLGLFSINNAKASTRSHYMDLGDKYLEKSNNQWSFEAEQSKAIKALACYTAALAEKGN